MDKCKQDCVNTMWQHLEEEKKEEEEIIDPEEVCFQHSKLVELEHNLNCYFINIMYSSTTYISSCHQFLGNWMLSMLTVAGLVGNSVAVVGKT